MLRKGLLVIIVPCSGADEAETEILCRDTSVQLLARYVNQSLPLNSDVKHILFVKEPLLCEGCSCGRGYHGYHFRSQLNGLVL